MTIHYLQPLTGGTEHQIADRYAIAEDYWRDGVAAPGLRVLRRFPTAKDDVARFEREHLEHPAAKGREVHLQPHPMLPLVIAGIAWGLIVVMAFAISPPLAGVMTIAGLITGLGYAIFAVGDSSNERTGSGDRPPDGMRGVEPQRRAVEVDVRLRVRSQPVRALGGTEGRSPAVPPRSSGQARPALGKSQVALPPAGEGATER